MVMKAIVVNQYGKPDVMEYKDVIIPNPGPREVLIKTQGTSVNFADTRIRTGQYHAPKTLPYIPGFEVTGIIDKVGPEVIDFKLGQRVIAFTFNGSYAEYALADDNLTFSIPDSIDIATAAAFPIAAFTSYNLLHRAARLEKGETVLIYAASGGVGTTAIQMARLLGAEKVIGTVSNNEKAYIASKMGADAVINYTEESFAEKVHELTNGQGVDIILDSIGGEVFNQSSPCLKMFGRFVNFGNSGGPIIGNLDKIKYASCQSFIGYSFGTYRKNRPETLKKTAESVIHYITNREITINVGRTFLLEEAKDAHELIESRKHTGKIILLPQ
jgi:NADPH2:quinone reductase